MCMKTNREENECVLLGFHSSFYIQPILCECIQKTCDNSRHAPYGFYTCIAEMTTFFHLLFLLQYIYKVFFFGETEINLSLSHSREDLEIWKNVTLKYYSMAWNEKKKEISLEAR
jgi:hypothetical protein